MHTNGVCRQYFNPEQVREVADNDGSEGTHTMYAVGGVDVCPHKLITCGAICIS